jgi:hypothetical protein
MASPFAMRDKPTAQDDPFTPPNAETPPSVACKWANRVTRVTRPSRFSDLRLTPFKIGVLLLIGTDASTRERMPKQHHRQVGPVLTPNSVTCHRRFNLVPWLTTTDPPWQHRGLQHNIHPARAIPTSEPNSYRLPDALDTFTTYKFRQTCNISSLDLQSPFSSLCATRSSMLTAISSGGRIGHDTCLEAAICEVHHRRDMRDTWQV